MEEIELVIKIPNEIRLALINNIQLSLDQQSWSDSYIKHAIVTGTMIPKGHGRLIDADALNFNADYNEPLISKLDFDNAPTIIEADTESE